MSAGCVLPGNITRPGWTEHNGGQGFAISHPTGWQVQLSQQKAVFVQSPDASAFVVIQPLISQGLGPQQWIERVPYNNPLFPQARVLRAGQLPGRPNEAIATIAFMQPTGQWQAGMICAVHGETGMLFIAASRAEMYRQNIPTLVEVLKSFHFTGDEPAQAQQNNLLAGIQWTRFVDPAENSFSLEVPQGWRVEGGLSRRSANDTRKVLTAGSPDGRILMFNNDPQLMLYTNPNPMIPIPEGQNYQGWNMRSYRDGAQFLQEYVPAKLSGICANVQFVDIKPRTDVDSAVNGMVMQAGLGNFLEYSFGEAVFNCQCQAGPMTGFYTAGVLRATANPSLVNWTPEFLSGFIASPDQFPAAMEIFTHMQKTFRIDQNWAAGQGALTMRTVEIQRRTNDQILGMILEAGQYRSNVTGEAARKFGNAMRGQVDLQGPDGTFYKGVAGSNYYWRHQGTGAIVGTDIDQPPALNTGFEQLLGF